jgi:hypothetical protein
MGCVPSRYDRYEYDRYTIFDERDRDDFDDFCGCGPWYGGEDYRRMRRRYLPGYGSPRGNYYGIGGYAGIYPPVAEESIVPEQMAMVPYRRQSQVIMPYQPQIVGPGYIAVKGSNGGYPYPRTGRW